MRFEAEVIAAYGRHLRVRDATGGEHDARPFGRRVQAVCGDRVACEHDAAHAEVHVTEVLQRSNVLERATTRDRKSTRLNSSHSSVSRMPSSA